MKKSESEKRLPENSKLSSIFEVAMANGTFGNHLQDLSFEELVELKNLMETTRKQEEKNATSAKFKVRVNRALGKELFSLKGIKEWQNMWNNLFKELSEVGDKIETDRRKKIAEYFRGFFDYLKTVDPKELGPNLTDWHINTYVTSAKEQKTPRENESGKVALSYNESFEDNLEFLKKHIAEAMAIANA